MGVFVPGWPRLHMDTTMSEEMISAARRVRRDKKIERGDISREEQLRINIRRKLPWWMLPTLN